MANSGKHRRPHHRKQRKVSPAGVIARGGLLGAVIVGGGIAVQHTAATAMHSKPSDVSNVADPKAPGPPVSRDFVRPPLLPTAAPAPTASASPAPTTGPRIDQAAIARAEKYIGAKRKWAHMCLGFVRTAFGLQRVESTAIGAWDATKHKHRGDSNPPAGVPVFWSGGSSGDGHVAFSLGGGSIISTDLPYPGHISKAQLSDVQAAWGLKYLGWTEDLEGVRVYTP